jgi:hypothetical protein
MKKLLLSAVFVASIAAPALAQSFTPEFGSGNDRNVPQADRSTGGANSAYAAYAYKPAPTRYHARRERGNGGANSAYAYTPAQKQMGSDYAKVFGFSY